MTSAELTGFRGLADLFNRKTEVEIDLESTAKELTEVCDAREDQV